MTDKEPPYDMLRIFRKEVKFKFRNNVIFLKVTSNLSPIFPIGELCKFCIEDTDTNTKHYTHKITLALKFKVTQKEIRVIAPPKLSFNKETSQEQKELLFLRLTSPSKAFEAHINKHIIKDPSFKTYQLEKIKSIAKKIASGNLEGKDLLVDTSHTLNLPTPI